MNIQTPRPKLSTVPRDGATSLVSGEARCPGPSVQELVARDVVPDAAVGRCYLPCEWLAEAGMAENDLARPESRAAVAGLAARLVLLSRPYRASARVGAARLPLRSGLTGDVSGRAVAAAGGRSPGAAR